MIFLELFSDYTFQIVALGCSLLGIVSGIIGSFAVLRKQSLLGDCISHASLPGVILMFLIIEVKQLELLLIGALISGLLATFCIMLIVKFSKLKYDSSLTIVLSVFLGFGLVLLTYAQKLDDASQSGLSNFIYGQAASMLQSDVKLIFIASVIIIIIVFLLYKEFKLFCFDSEFMITLGYNNLFINSLITLLIVVTIVIGLQTVGVILMSAMLISPAVAARQWVDKLHLMIFLSSLFGFVSAFLGVITSSIISSMPTGPIIIVYSSIIVFLSILFAPNRGVLFKIYRRSKVVI